MRLKCLNLNNRSATTDMKLLQVELSRAQRRIKALEEALQVAHAKVADSMHPLLSETHSSTNDSPRFSPYAEAQTPSDEEFDLSETLGTLAITDGGESRFFGPSAASEVSTAVAYSDGYTIIIIIFYRHLYWYV